MGIDIDVNLNKIGSDDIAKIKAQLQGLGDDVDIDFDIDDIINGDLDDVFDGDLEKKMNVAMDSNSQSQEAANFFDRSSMSQSGKIIQELQRIRRTIASKGVLRSGGGGGDGGDGDSKGIFELLDDDANRKTAFTDFLDDFAGNSNFRSPLPDLTKSPPSGGVGSRGDGPGIDAPFIGKLSRLKPTFGKLYAIAAVLLPIIAGLAVQAGAVATALGGIAVAGGALALGILGGQAETLAGSMATAEERIKGFKQELFQAIQPAADLFAPLVSGMMDRVIKNVRGVTDEIASLGSYSGFFNFAIDQFGSLAEEVLQVVNDLQPAIESIARPLVKGFTDKLPTFLRNVIKEGANVAPTLGKIGAMLWEVGRVVYFVLKAIVNFIGILSVLTPVIRTIANILGNKWIQSLLIVVAAIASLVGLLYAFTVVGGIVVGVFSTLNGMMAMHGGLLAAVKAMWGGSWIMAAISRVGGLISIVMGLNGALGVTAKLLTAIVGLATLGAGLAVVAGAIGAVGDALTPSVQTPKTSPMDATSNRGGGNEVNMNFYGDMNNQQEAKMEDIADDMRVRDSLSKGKFSAN